VWSEKVTLVGHGTGAASVEYLVHSPMIRQSHFQVKNLRTILQMSIVGVLDEPFSAKPAQRTSHTGPPGYIGLSRFQPTLQRKSHLCIFFWELRGLGPNFHIHASVSDLCIPTIDLPIQLQKICGPILGIYKSLTGTRMWKLGLGPRNSQRRNT
jgi:hypothetical protein